MNNNEHFSRYEHNEISGSGIIQTGGKTKTNGPVTNVSGSGNTTTVGMPMDGATVRQWKRPICEILAQARYILEATPESDEVSDALAAIHDTQLALDDPAASGLADSRKLRERIRRLIAVLTPAAQIAAGLNGIITSFSQILKHL